MAGQGGGGSLCVGAVIDDRPARSAPLPRVPGAVPAAPHRAPPPGAAPGCTAAVSEAELAALAGALAACARRGDIIALHGPLGAGKTVFARHFIRAFAARHGAAAGEVPSPTFTLAQLYPFGADTIWHLDLYRIGAPEELWEIGFEEALAGGICLIEWPERAGSLLPPRRLDIRLAHTADPQRRRISVEDRTGAAARLQSLFDRLAGRAR